MTCVIEEIKLDDLIVISAFKKIDEFISRKVKN